MMVSEVGFGAFAIGGHLWGRVDDGESLAALRRAFDLGVNFCDTADVYGHGHSEELIGQAFAGRRANVVIATKCGFDFYAGEPARSNFDAAYLRTALERSLSRLGTDYVDVLQLHNPPQKLAREGALWEALAALKAEGKVRFYGVSARTANDARAYLRAAGDAGVPADPEVVQVGYNLLEREAAAKGVFEEAQGLDMGVVSRVPLASGMLTGKYGVEHRFGVDDFRAMWSPARREATARQIEALRFLAASGRSLGQAAIAFALSQEAVSTVIVGAKTAAQVEANVGASDLAPLGEEELRRVGEVFGSG